MSLERLVLGCVGPRYETSQTLHCDFSHIVFTSAHYLVFTCTVPAIATCSRLVLAHSFVGGATVPDSSTEEPQDAPAEPSMEANAAAAAGEAKADEEATAVSRSRSSCRQPHRLLLPSRSTCKPKQNDNAAAERGDSSIEASAQPTPTPPEGEAAATDDGAETQPKTEEQQSSNSTDSSASPTDDATTTAVPQAAEEEKKTSEEPVAAADASLCRQTISNKVSFGAA